MSKSSTNDVIIKPNSLLSRLSSLSKEVEAPCPLGRLHKKMDIDTARSFVMALQSPASTMAIHQALIDEGYSISRNTLNNKRQCFKNGEDDKCLCFPNNLKDTK